MGGADLIVGSHPHVIQPIRYETWGKTDSIPVAYSLGNFISNQKQPNTDIGLIYEVTLQQDSLGQVYLKDHDYTPVYRYRHKPKAKTTFYTIPTPVFLDPKNPHQFPEAERKEVQQKDAFMRKHLGNLGNGK